MAVDLVGAVVGSPTAAITQSSLGQDDFIKILLTQLTYQDPLKPLDNQEFIAQMAQFSALEQTRQMNEKLDGLLLAQASTQSFGLVGKIVEFSNNVNGTLTGKTEGKVVSVAFESGQPLLKVSVASGFEDIRLSNIVLVR